MLINSKTFGNTLTYVTWNTENIFNEFVHLAEEMSISKAKNASWLLVVILKVGKLRNKLFSFGAESKFLRIKSELEMLGDSFIESKSLSSKSKLSS